MRTLPLTVPLDQYQLSSGFGSRPDPLHGRKENHRGLDFRAAMKAQVYATAPGRVIHAGWAGPFGRMVEIDPGHGLPVVNASGWGVEWSDDYILRYDVFIKTK